jgi:DNA-binding transcriptional LysR family regulator
MTRVMPFAAPAPWTTKMTLTQLRYLVAIADSGLNITHAAGRVYATQPGLSKQIKRLEDELGFLIFQRRGRSLASLTAAGAQVLDHARRVLAEAGRIRALRASHRHPMAPHLTGTTQAGCNQ